MIWKTYLEKPYIIKMQLAFPVFWYAINLKEIFQEESKIFRRKNTIYQLLRVIQASKS